LNNKSAHLDAKAKKRSCSPARRGSDKGLVSVPWVKWDPTNPFGLKPKPLPYIALHEAGHLVAALVLGVPLKQKAATIVAKDGVLGVVHFRDWEAATSGKITDRVQLENYAICYLAARAVDEISCGHCLESTMCTGAEGDLASVDLILGFLMPSNLPEWQDELRLRKHYWWFLLARAHSIVSENWGTVEAFSKALLDRGNLTLAEARRIRRNVNVQPRKHRPVLCRRATRLVESSAVRIEDRRYIGTNAASAAALYLANETEVIICYDPNSPQKAIATNLNGKKIADLRDETLTARSAR
jgi:hypothetical protein